MYEEFLSNNAMLEVLPTFTKTGIIFASLSKRDRVIYMAHFELTVISKVLPKFSPVPGFLFSKFD